MSHPDDMGAQEDLAAGCFILFVFGIALVIAAAVFCGIAYLIYHFYTQGIFS